MEVVEDEHEGPCLRELLEQRAHGAMAAIALVLERNRAFGSDQLTSPCGFVSRGEFVYVPELNASLKVIDNGDRVVATLGANEAVVKVPGWPNHDKKLIEPGKFNSPHGMAVAPNGAITGVSHAVYRRIR